MFQNQQRLIVESSHSSSGPKPGRSPASPVFEKENYSLKHENEILKRKVEGLEKILEIKSNGHVSITTSEMDDEKELEKEEVNLD